MELMVGEYGEFEEKCESSIEHFKREAGRMRAGRAHVGLLEGIMVDYYGSMVPLNQVGTISAPESRLLTVQVYDAGAVTAVDKAIQQSDLGLNPSRDGQLIRINIPALTEERRKDLVKLLHKLAEETKVALRNHRRDAIEILRKQEKEKDISKDDLHHAQEDIQKITDRFTAETDKLLAEKEQDMMVV